MGRTAVGVRGITLGDGDALVGAAIARPGAQVLTVTEQATASAPRWRSIPPTTAGARGSCSTA